jgi:hypothetical protein
VLPIGKAFFPEHMQRRAVMKRAILIIFISAALCATALAAGKTSVLVGYIGSIEKDYIIMNDTQFKLINTKRNTGSWIMTERVISLELLK